MLDQSTKATCRRCTSFTLASNPFRSPAANRNDAANPSIPLTGVDGHMDLPLEPITLKRQTVG